MLSFELRVGKVKTGLITDKFTIISPIYKDNKRHVSSNFLLHKL